MRATHLRGLVRREWACFWIAIALSGVMSPSGLGAQAVMLGLRGGGGIDEAGSPVYRGQMEVTELGASNSIQLAIVGLAGVRLAEDYEELHAQRYFDYRERTRVWTVALRADFLFRHARRGGGPYFVAGFGIGPQWVHWTIAGAYDRRGQPVPGGGTFLEEDSVIVGTMINLGIGQRLYEHLDVRAEFVTLLAPSTDARALKLLPAFTLSTGIGF